ncbi:Aldo/keto reductase subgroup [Apiospora rasikravindrae]|uniref:Aldo/keto reductase subgroup n=1 Tax=Apiospora rasikravindrae TaxID=990691 RepID=A0ABR1U894_9PEZI
MSSAEVKIVWGATGLWAATPELTETWLEALQDLNITDIDTAQNYGKSEELLGQVGAASRFLVDTKVSETMGPTVATGDVVVKSGRESLEKLKTKSVNVYYLHFPERRCALEDTLSGIDTLYREGAFKKFGLSNFLPHEVEDVVRICQEKGYVLPSVFQGTYSAVARRAETELLPILRKHDIAFYAYSPIAGGFLTKTRDVLEKGAGTGRWDPNSYLGKVYLSLYSKPSYLDALDAWVAIARDEGVSQGELAYRWVCCNSALRGEFGDGILIGGLRPEAFREAAGWIKKGPLSAEAARRIDGLWEGIKADAPLDNFNDCISKMPSS